MNQLVKLLFYKSCDMNAVIKSSDLIKKKINSFSLGIWVHEWLCDHFRFNKQVSFPKNKYFNC